jgi:HK97 gp10 family phage protein
MASKSIDQQAAELVAKFQKKGKELDSILAVAINEASIFVENKAVLEHPWKNDTGLLQKSITHRVIFRRAQPVGQIGTATEYATYLEFGTTRMQPYPFLRPALNSSKSTIKEIIARRLKQAL